MTMNMDERAQCAPNLKSAVEFRKKHPVSNIVTTEDWEVRQVQGMKETEKWRADLCSFIESLPKRDTMSPEQIKGLEAKVGTPERSLMGYGSRAEGYLNNLTSDREKLAAIRELTGYLVSAPDATEYANRLKSMTTDTRETLNDYMHREIVGTGKAQSIYSNTGSTITNTILYRAAESSYTGADLYGNFPSGASQIQYAINPKIRSTSLPSAPLG